MYIVIVPLFRINHVTYKCYTSPHKLQFTYTVYILVMDNERMDQVLSSLQSNKKNQNQSIGHASNLSFKRIPEKAETDILIAFLEHE